MNTCETCQHWRPLSYPAERTSFAQEKEPGSWGYCGLIGDGADPHDERDEADRAVSQRAFTRDGSDWWSSFFTRSDFGCVEHEPKEPS